MENPRLIKLHPFQTVFGRFISFVAAAFLAAILAASLNAQVPEKASMPTPFRIGEKITYSVSFDKFSDVAYAEIYAVSRGNLSGKDSVELRSKIKTLNFFSAAFYAVDEIRTTYVAADTGLPLYVSKTENLGGLPKETIFDYLKAPTINHDLLALIYRIRQSGGSGAATLVENEKTYGVTFQPAGTERVKAAGGDFETTIVAVQSDYLTELGLTDLKVNLSNDEARIPVLVRIKTAKGIFRAEAASIQSIIPEPDVAPTPAPVNSPRPTPTPVAVRTPEPYLDNQPLAPELSFDLGESLEYRISASGRPVGTFVLRARERKEIDGIDTLVLAATVTGAEPGNPLFNLNDSIVVHANPETLAPRRIAIKLSGGLGRLSQTATFDDKTGAITYRGNSIVEAPIGTHSILSLLYAIRSFNLKPSKDLSNPVNDTRVAVFWESQPYIFSLRPSPVELITLQGEKVSAQLVSVGTRNEQLDQLGLKIWLANDNRRAPLRFIAGGYQADLISTSTIPPK